MDIEKLAREAGLGESLGSWCQECGIKDEQIRRFAALVVEECAKVCEQYSEACAASRAYGLRCDDGTPEGCAAAIRAQVPPVS